jgi:hypothetical protein
MRYALKVIGLTCVLQHSCNASIFGRPRAGDWRVFILLFVVVVVGTSFSLSVSIVLPVP